MGNGEGTRDGMGRLRGLVEIYVVEFGFYSGVGYCDKPVGEVGIGAEITELHESE